MIENLKVTYYHYRWAKIVTCLLLMGAGYLLFQIAGGFPPWAWRFLFNVLPRLTSLWAAQGSGMLLPFIGLLLLCFSLLTLWAIIVLGISQSIVLFWQKTDLAEVPQPDLDTYTMQSQQQTLQPPQAYEMQFARTQAGEYDDYVATNNRILQPFSDENYFDNFTDEEDEATDWVEQGQYIQQASEEQQAQSTLQSRQFQQAFVQQAQQLRGAVPTYAPAPRNTWSSTQHKGAAHGHLRLVPEEVEQEDHSHAHDDAFLEEEDIQSLKTRPIEEDEDKTNPVLTAWNDDEQEATLRLVVGIGLDPGLVRKDRPNEDSLFAIQGIRTTQEGPIPAGLFVIADGMGGHANGREASRLAVRSISDIIVPALLRDDSENAQDTDDAEDEQRILLNLLKDGVQRANSAIYQRNRTLPDMMGTTVTTALVVNTTAYVVNVGDSRTYLYRAAEGLVPITRDHSVVADLVKAGMIKQDEIYTHPQRNQIYRCLGEHATIETDTFVVQLQPDDILLLCSDGLWEMVRDAAMEKIIASSSHLPAQISSILVQAALNQGGVDNISAVVVGIVKTTL